MGRASNIFVAPISLPPSTARRNWDELRESSEDGSLDDHDFGFIEKSAFIEDKIEN
jgi:hypothetical protein